MKLKILILFFFIFKLNSATWIEESVGIILNYEKVLLPDGTIYSISKGSGAGKDNVGNYSIAKCIGHRLEKNNKLLELKFFCDVELSNGDKYFTMQNRNNSDTDVGVGEGMILGGTGVFSKLVGTKCIYGVKHMKSNVFTTTKCEIPKSIFNKLKSNN